MAVVDRQATFTDTSTRISSIVIVQWPRSVAVMDRQDTFTDTRICSMLIAQWPQSVAVMDRQDTFTDASTRISNMLIALWLQSVVAVVDRQATFITRISSMDRVTKSACSSSSNWYYILDHHLRERFDVSHYKRISNHTIKWDQLMSPPTLKIMDEKFTASCRELPGCNCVIIIYCNREYWDLNV